MDVEKSVDGLKKFLEGWVSHRNELVKTWKKYWMVLRGNFILLYTSEKANKENMFGSICLGSGTHVSDVKSKKGFKFELTTLNNRREKTKNAFKFTKEDDFHLWKAYILAIATGTIPNDVQLLPGQRLDVYDAIVEMKRSLAGSGPSSASSSAAGPAGGPRRASCPGGPTTRPTDPYSSRINHDRLERLENGDDEEEEEEIQNDPLLLQIKQLERRREDIAKRDIGGINLSTSTGTLSSTFGSPLIEIPPSASSVQSTPDQKGHPLRSQSTTFLPGQGSTGQRSPSGSQSQNFKAPSERASFLSLPHPFYPETAGHNNETDIPSWFVNCSRAQSEEILSAKKKMGTVLMRANSRFPVTGNYVISFRRDIEGKVVVSHYNIVRSPDGFKIDVENQHDAMACLSSVMEFFLSVAGTTARPLTSNDLTQLLGKYQASAFPSISSGDVPVQLRSQTSISSSSSSSDSRKPRQRIDALGSSPVPTPAGSNRSSSIQSSSGSPGSRTSRVSFDFSGRRPSDPHHGYTGRSSTASSSGVFYPGGSVSSAPGPQRSPFNVSPSSGSLRDSVYSGPVPVSPDRVQGMEHGSAAALRGTMSVPDNLEIYTNHEEMIATESSGTSGTGGSGTGTETRSWTTRRGSQTPSIAGSSTSNGSHGSGSHMNRLPGTSSHGTHGSGTPQSTYGSGTSQSAYGPGSLQSTYGSGPPPSTYGSGPPQSTYGSGTSQSAYGPGSIQSTYGSGPPQTTYGSSASQSAYGPGSLQSTYGSGPPPSTYGPGMSQGTYGPGSLQSTSGSEASSTPRSPLQSTYGNSTQGSRIFNTQSSVTSDSQSTVSTKGYGGHRPPGTPGTPGQLSAKIPPPLPPPKPSSQEIYIMMKPVRPSSEDDYSCRSEVTGDGGGGYGQSTVDESNGAQQSVKDLARMLQCAVTLGK